MRRLTGVLVSVLVACVTTEAADRSLLQPQPYKRLPMGSVRARTWLRHQLELQRDGLTGNAYKLYHDIAESTWITDGRKRGGHYAWQIGPYYARGMIALAYVLDDEGLKGQARRWVEKTLAWQATADRQVIADGKNLDPGDFGPIRNSWWANTLAIHYLRDHYEATNDERVIGFLDGYFRYQLKRLPEWPLKRDSQWALARGGDNLDIVLWLYKETGEEYLVDLAKILVEQTGQWHRYFATGDRANIAYPDHIVNLNQGLKSPPLFYLVTGSEEHRSAYGKAFDEGGWLWRKCGRVDGMVSGTEPLTDRSSTQGTELCAIVERILSSSIAIRILGDPLIGDHMERTAYNCLPASLSHDIKGLRYYVLPNQPKCTNEKLGFKHNGNKENSICPSPHSGFRCCRSCFHMGWPKFVHNMWMATADGGLAVAAYGPNSVTAKVGEEGVAVEVEQDTDYPFKEDVTLTIKTRKSVAFPLDLRIPGWCSEPEVRTNGEKLKGVEPGSFFRVDRKWRDGDTITLRFPMTPRSSLWINNSVAITRGPLVYSLLIEEGEWKSTRSYANGRFHTYEILPKSDWNYALVLDDPAKPKVKTDISRTMPRQPFKAADAPVRLTLKAVKTDVGGWGAFRGDFPARAKEPPQSPVRAGGRTEEITLVPYGSTEIRITQFPWVRE